MELHEKILATQEIYNGRVVNLSVSSVELPDGKVSQREIVNHPGAVTIIALDEDDQVLMVKQYRLPADKVLLELPAGTLEPGEDPEEAAIRELQEETGYKPTSLESFGGFYNAPGYSSEYIHLFYTQDLQESALEPDDDEFLEVVKVPFEKSLKMIEKGEIQDGKTIIGLLRVASKR